MFSTPSYPVIGTTGLDRAGELGGGGPSFVAVLPGEDRTPLFDRIVALYQGNAFLLSELRALRSRRASARAYLETPGVNRVLAETLLDHLRMKQSAILTILRANRIQARALLAEIDAPPEGI